MTDKKSIELIAKLIVCGFRDLKSGSSNALIMQGKNTQFMVYIHKNKPTYEVYDLSDPYEEHDPVCEKINKNSAADIISAMSP